MVFPVVIYGCESWTVKKAEHRRINAFEPWCWRRLLRVTWTARRSNQSILEEISPGCSGLGRTDVEAETLILWLPDVKSWLIGKDPDAGKDWRQEEKGMTEDEMVGWHHRLNGHGFGWTLGAGVLQFMGSQRIGHNWVTELNWTEYSHIVSDHIRSVVQSCLTLCDPMSCSMPGLPVHHQLPDFTQIHVHEVADAI